MCLSLIGYYKNLGRKGIYTAESQRRWNLLSQVKLVLCSAFTLNPFFCLEKAVHSEGFLLTKERNSAVGIDTTVAAFFFSLSAMCIESLGLPLASVA